MKPVCQFLLLLLSLALAACQSQPSATPAAPAALPLNQLETPATLGQWRLQGSIGQDTRLHVARYQWGDNTSQVMDISLYPLPDGWQHFPPEQALARHFGMLSQQLATSASNKYRADKVEIANTQTHPAANGEPPRVNSRFISHFPDGSTRITLVSLTLYRGNFVRLTLTCPPAQADALAVSLDAARETLLAHFASQSAGAASAND